MALRRSVTSRGFSTQRDIAHIQPDVLLLDAVGVVPVHRLKAWVNVLTSLYPKRKAISVKLRLLS